jgi:GNAT superfamily N-acetyltransferase
MFKIEWGKRSDIEDLLVLIKELALFEKAPEQVTNTVERLLEDGFGENCLFKFLVARVENKTVGMALWYYRYSTWTGKCLYLEDLYVTEAYRGLKLGEALFKAVIQVAKEENCTKMVWQVLDWNQSAIDFYKKFGAHVGEDQFINAYIDLR